MLAFSRNNYYLVGGHVKDNESYEECLKREVLEEALKTCSKVNVVRDIIDAVSEYLRQN